MHNQYRAAHHSSPLTWDNGLQASAQNWANNLAASCSFYHSGPGENLASGFDNWADVAWAWYEEVRGGVAAGVCLFNDI